MKRLIGYTAALCLLAVTVGCGGVTSTGTLAYISNSTGSGFTVYTVNTDGTLTVSNISPQSTPAPPRVLQFAPNSKWAYFLDAAGDNIYAYTRAGNGTLQTLINSYPVGPGANALVVSPNSSFLYVSLPNTLGGALAVFSIDPSTGILSQVGSNLQVGSPMTQLVMAPSGGALFGVSPSAQAVLAWSLNSTSGVATFAGSTGVGIDPVYIVLSANGSYLYVLDHTETTAVGSNPSIICATTTTANSNCSPDIFGYNVSGTTLSPMAGASVGGGTVFNNVFNENADLITGLYPQGPIAGATSNDSRYLFVANQGSHNITVFKISTTSGEPTEILGSLKTVNGIQVSTASPFDCGTGCSTPSFLSVAKANNALYLLDTPTGKIFQFAINQSTGQVRPLNPASVGAESATSNPTWITIQQD